MCARFTAPCTFEAVWMMDGALLCRHSVHTEPRSRRRWGPRSRSLSWQSWGVCRCHHHRLTDHGLPFAAASSTPFSLSLISQTRTGRLIGVADSRAFPSPPLSSSFVPPTHCIDAPPTPRSPLHYPEITFIMVRRKDPLTGARAPARSALRALFLFPALTRV